MAGGDQVEVNNPTPDINTKLQYLNSLINECNLLVAQYNTDVPFNIQKYKSYRQEIQTLRSSLTPITEFQQNIYINECEQVINAINHQRSLISSSFNSILNLFADIESGMIERLKEWRRVQLLSGFDYRSRVTTIVDKSDDLKNELDTIQIQYEGLFDCVLNTRNILNTIYIINNGVNISDNVQSKFNPKIDKLLFDLISRSFIIDLQPPQIVKRDIRFDASVRLLLPKFLKDEQNYNVSVSIVPETMDPERKPSGKIWVKNDRFKRYEGFLWKLSCNFKSLKLYNLDQRRGKNVTDQKHVFIFKTTVNFEGTERNVLVKSLPVVITLHPYQEPSAWATIVWNNLLEYYGRPPVASSAPWHEMSFILGKVFLSQTGCVLYDYELSYLEQRAIQLNFIRNGYISYRRFCKTELENLKLTFWDWFYGIMKLTREHLSGPWNDGLIAGFIGKNKTEEILVQCVPGTFLLRFCDTFLLRFCDTRLGGISVAWVENENGNRCVKHLKSFISKDFDNSNLGGTTIGDHIRYIDQCMYLYRNTPKDVAFGKYYTNRSEN
ncbi:signal transducer and transcription activator-like [Contarinia nasturtii]|uniref:signal transducer and transcription activator-like n=1 Tax=Contarinia nasturtii TaxID=265458 RepID=UPI0012D41E1D|nr:signal transducer and transcription activator-like [Contarinia nasturtii]